MGSGEDQAAASQRLAGLQTITTLLAPLRTPTEVAEVIVREGAVAIGGHGGSLCLLNETRESFELVHEVGYAREVAERWRSFPATAPVPAVDAIRTRSIVTICSHADRDREYPVFAGNPTTDEAHAVIPLFGSSGAPLGVFTVGWPHPRTFSADELAFLQALGGHCALAIERARLYAAATQAAEQQAFLADISRELSSSLDLDTTPRRVLELAVPAVADSASLHLLRDDSLHMVAVAHVRPEGEEAMRVLSARTGDVARDERMLHVARTGEPLVYPEIDDALWRAIAEDEEELRLLKALDIRSAVLVPLLVKERVLGTLALTTCRSSGRRMSEADLPFVQAVAERAALAIDNAMTHARLAQMAVTLQQSLLPAAPPSIPGLDVAVRYRPVGEGGVGGDFYDIFPLPDAESDAPRRWGVLIGDVAGKGVDAAALTSLVRYTARAVASIEPSPAAVLSHCNRAVLAAGIGEAFATLLYLIVEPGDDHTSVTVAAGGHPLPVVREADGTVRTVGTPGPAIGLFPDSSWTTDAFEVRAGDTLALFTDGLLEARSPAGAFAPHLLGQTLRSSLGADAAGTARAIMAAVDAFERGRARDDLALVVLSVPANYDLHDVVLLDVPSLVVVRSNEYLEELTRELELVRRGRNQELTEDAYPQRLLVLIDQVLTLWSGSREATRLQAEQALASGRVRTDLHLRLPPIAAAVAEHFGALLDEVEQFSKSGQLLTVAPPEELRGFQRWFLNETARQLRGESGPVRYPFASTLESVGRTGAEWPTASGRAPRASVRHAAFVVKDDVSATGEARRFLRGLGDAWALRDCVDEALVPLSELVTNAVLHAAGGEVRVAVTADDARLRVEVHDADERIPSPHSHELDSGTGRGLQLVAAMTERWGAEPTDGGKVMWFELGIQRPER